MTSDLQFTTVHPGIAEKKNQSVLFSVRAIMRYMKGWVVGNR